jgi:sulfopyruvate decarboxylase TPP-binding subunit
MYDALKASPLHLVPVCREGEAFGIAAGLHLGGKTPVVLIQNTGLFESGDVLRGNILNLQMPLLLMVGYRGYHEMVNGQGPVDSAATFTKPILDAWGIVHYLLDTDDDVPKIAAAFKKGREASRPVAVLIGQEYDA